ncbi:MAG: hypothetical protein IT381_04950 [Deltaproteobacteria bacterium]|nr:hypothetical protein [Deltaproteobacteria bacterium]
MILRLLLVLVLAPIPFIAGCPKKQTSAPQASPLDKDGIRRRANATHDDLKREEGKSEERKADQ